MFGIEDDEHAKVEGLGNLGQMASIALACVVVLLSASALLGALFSYQTGAATKRAIELSLAFEQARFFVAEEESLERKYRLEPSVEVRLHHQEAGGSLRSSIQAALVDNSRDVSFLRTVLENHQRYDVAIDRMFAAIDVGDTVLANKIDMEEVDPAFDWIESKVFAAAATYQADARQNLTNLATVQKTVLVATPVVFIAGMGLVAFFWNLIRKYRRRVRENSLHEAAAIRISERRFRSLIQYASDVVLICSPAGLINYQSPACVTAWGYQVGELVGTPLHELIKIDDQAALAELWGQLLTVSGKAKTIELRLSRESGNWRQVELILDNLLHEEGVAGIVATVRDVTERKAFENQLAQKAFYDSLTGLPNRALFRDRLDQAFARAERRDGSVGLLFLDLDNFKQINDGLGHDIGDQLLVEASTRLQACVREENTVARLGGDEFVILLEYLTSEADAVLVADRIAQHFVQPFRLGGRDLHVTVSVGIALGNEGHDLADNILRNADVAMYRAKSNGKGRYAIFDATMQDNTLARLELENDLRAAVERNELRVHYQPIVFLATGHVAGVEALVRWQHPVRGLIAPGEFITIAEDSGIIVQLGQWVLEEACHQVAIWQVQFPDRPPLTVSVNLSPRQFQQSTLVENVQRALRESSLAPASLTLEITEGVIMRDVEATITVLWQLKNLGIQLAVDDFGTGYSSLAYLKRLPLDVLKIDRSFVTGIGHDQEDTAITKAIISLAKSLNLAITGEGIETSEQSELLEAWACDRGQGYHFARPLDSAALTELLQTLSASNKAMSFARSAPRPRFQNVELASLNSA